MSKCISSHGEYSEHDLTGAERFICQRCWALDEDAIMAALAASEAELLTLREQRDKVLAALDVYDEAHPHDEWEHVRLGVDLAASTRRAFGVTEGADR